MKIADLFSGRRARLVEGVVVSTGLVVFFAGSIQHGRVVNTDRFKTDQNSYMNYAKSVWEDPTGYVGGRNRMPVYPYLQALLYDEDLSDEAFFERGKRFNIVLGGVLLVGLYVIFRTSLSASSAIVLWALTTFTVFIFRAAYLQVELLFYSLLFVAFILMIRALGKPYWQFAAAAGGVLGIAYLCKASVLPALLLFLGFLVVAALREVHRALLDDRPVARRLGRRLVQALVVVAAFLVVTGPYLRTSNRVFGRYFYNVNSTFYMWYDSWDEALKGTGADGRDRVGWPDHLPEEAIPGPEKYLREHTAWEVLRRPWRGLHKMHAVASGSYGYFKYVQIYLALGLLVGLVRFGRTVKLLHRIRPIPEFTIVFVGAYVLLYAWYTPITAGSRLFLALFLPLMWSLFRFLEHFRDDLRTPSIGGRRTSWITLAHIGVGLVLLFDLVLVLWPRLLRVYAGA